jgi:hypothetical protein
VWYSVHVHWCRPRHDHSPHGVRLWTLKKEAGLPFQKDRKKYVAVLIFFPLFIFTADLN